jgi:hypothetical protein
MRVTGDTTHGLRTRALIVVLCAPGCASARRLRWPRVTLTGRAAASSFVAARAESDARSAWTGGPGSRSTRGCASESRCRSARCCASSTAQHKDHHGRRPPSERRCAPLPSARVCVGDSRRTSFDTRTRSRWPAKAYRSTSSNDSSATRISGSRRSTYKGSTTAKSSRRWAPARRRPPGECRLALTVVAQSGSDSDQDDWWPVTLVAGIVILLPRCH